MHSLLTAISSTRQKTTIILPDSEKRDFFCEDLAFFTEKGICKEEVTNLTWKEYEMDPTCVADWLSWGGLVHPSIMRGKDDSFFGVLAYEPYQPVAGQPVVLPEFKNGWCFWLEHQHQHHQDRHYLVVAWNPFFNRGHIINGILKKSMEWEEAKETFLHLLQDTRHALEQVTTCHLLEYQEILDFLEFSLSIGDRHVEMPEVPLYLDALLSQDIDLDFTHSHLRIDGKKLCVLSLTASCEDAQLEKICDAFEAQDYRHVRRLLLFSPKRAKKEELWYTANWCPGRGSLRQLINQDILKTLNGYHMDAFFFPFAEEQYPAERDRLTALLDSIELPYLIENYHQKNVWWGSLPGMFRSNIVPPILGFDSLDELLAHGYKKGDDADVSDKLVPAQ